MTPCSIEAFDHRFPTYRNALEAYARKRVSREEAEDLVCVCYESGRKSLDWYDARRDLYAWLTGILENLLRQYFRRARIRGEKLYPSDACPLEGTDEQSGESAQWEAQRQRLYRRIASIDLTARQYECLVRTLDGETQQQIGDSLHISQRMVSYHLQAAHERLRDPTEYDIMEWPLDFFHQCAHHPIYRKPHSFDTSSTSLERERRRYDCLQEEARRKAQEERKTNETIEGENRKEDKAKHKTSQRSKRRVRQRNL